MSIGQKVASLRVRDGMTQEELAKRLNVTQVSVSRIERGHDIPTALRLAELADIFGCTTDELLGREPAEGR